MTKNEEKAKLFKERESVNLRIFQIEKLLAKKTTYGTSKEILVKQLENSRAKAQEITEEIRNIK
jgi:hypothetical protein